MRMYAHYPLTIPPPMRHLSFSVKNERALLVPHIGTHTFETLAAMETLAMENAERAVTKQPLLTVVPEQLHLAKNFIS